MGLFETEKEIIERLKKDVCKKPLPSPELGWCPPITEAQDALNELIRFFLGKDWYVVDPLSNGQVNTIALLEIEQKYQKSLIRILTT